MDIHTLDRQARIQLILVRTLGVLIGLAIGAAIFWLAAHSIPAAAVLLALLTFAIGYVTGKGKQL